MLTGKIKIKKHNLDILFYSLDNTEGLSPEHSISDNSEKLFKEEAVGSQEG